MEHLKIGDYTLTWLDGGVTYLDGGAMFGVVPKALWSKKYPVNEKNQIELRTDPILIEGNGKRIIVEGGIGNGRLNDKQKRNYGVLSESHIEDCLGELGLTTADIDHVIMTHLHFDHVTGLSKYQDGELVPTFENANIYTTEVEWNEMRHPNIRSKNTYWEDNWKPIEHKVELYKESFEVAEGITLHHTGGHSDGHAIMMIKSGGETLVHMADLMPTHAHAHVLWVLAYDDYPMDSIYQKQKWLPVGIEEQAWFSFYHDGYYRAIKWNENQEIIDEVKRVRNNF